MAAVLWTVLWVGVYIYVLWCLYVKAIYGLLWTDLLILQYTGDEVPKTGAITLQ